MMYSILGGTIGFLLGGIIGGAMFGPLGSLVGSIAGIPIGMATLRSLRDAGPPAPHDHLTR